MLEEVQLFSMGKEQRTINTYTSYGRRLERFLQQHRLQLQDLKPIDVKRFIIEAGTNTQGVEVENSKVSYKRFMKAFTRFLGRTDLVEYIKQNMREIRTVNKFAVDLSLTEVLELINLTKRIPLKFAWSMMAFTGLRPGEVLGLHYSDIHVEKKRVRLLRREECKYYAKNMKVGQTPKTIPLNDLSLQLFKQLKQRRGERIIPVSYEALRKHWNHVVTEAGLVKDYPMTMHKLRHFFGHYWNRNKGNIRTLQKVLRHSDIETTLLYTEPSEVEVREEFEAVMNLENILAARKR